MAQQQTSQEESDPQPSTSGIVSQAKPSQQEIDSDSDSGSSDSEPSIVSVTVMYEWQHPLLNLLGISRKPKVLITNDFDHWTTGSFVKDIPNPSELDLNMNETILVIPFEPLACEPLPFEPLEQ